MYNIRTVAIYGGGGKYEMSKALKEQVPELVVATPGRFIEMVSRSRCNNCSGGWVLYAHNSYYSQIFIAYTATLILSTYYFL